MWEEKEMKQMSRQEKRQCLKMLIGDFCSGTGAYKRIWRFSSLYAFNFIYWSAISATLLSWAIIAGLFFGPEHNYFFSWLCFFISETPIYQLQAAVHKYSIDFAQAAAFFGGVFAFIKSVDILAQEKFIELSRGTNVSI